MPGFLDGQTYVPFERQDFDQSSKTVEPYCCSLIICLIATPLLQQLTAAEQAGTRFLQSHYGLSSL